LSEMITEAMLQHILKTLEGINQRLRKLEYDFVTQTLTEEEVPSGKEKESETLEEDNKTRVETWVSQHYPLTRRYFWESRETAAKFTFLDCRDFPSGTEMRFYKYIPKSNESKGDQNTETSDCEHLFTEFSIEQFSVEPNQCALCGKLK